MPTPYYGPPDSWYEPDPDEYDEKLVEIAYDEYLEEEGHEPDTDSIEWRNYLDRWMEWHKGEMELARYGL
jgi:hypothetical protein